MTLESSLPYLGNKWPLQRVQNSRVIYLFDMCFPVCFLQPWDKSCVNCGWLSPSHWRGMNQFPASFITCCLKSSLINASFIWYGLKLYITHLENGRETEQPITNKNSIGDLDGTMLRKDLQSLICFHGDAWPNSHRDLCFWSFNFTLSDMQWHYMTDHFIQEDVCIFQDFIINIFWRVGIFLIQRQL